MELVSIRTKIGVKSNIIVIAQIEHIDAVQNLDKILSVSGIDGVIIGPYDLSASLGFSWRIRKTRS